MNKKSSFLCLLLLILVLPTQCMAFSLKEFFSLPRKVPLPKEGELQLKRLKLTPAEGLLATILGGREISKLNISLLNSPQAKNSYLNIELFLLYYTDGSATPQRISLSTASNKIDPAIKQETLDYQIFLFWGLEKATQIRTIRYGLLPPSGDVRGAAFIPLDSPLIDFQDKLGSGLIASNKRYNYQFNEPIPLVFFHFDDLMLFIPSKLFKDNNYHLVSLKDVTQKEELKGRIYILCLQISLSEVALYNSIP